MNASEPAVVTLSPSLYGMDDGFSSKPPLRRESEIAETPQCSRNNKTFSVSRHSEMPARLEDEHPRNKVHFPSEPHHRKRSWNNGTISLENALDRTTAIMSATPAPSVQLPDVQQATKNPRYH